MSGSSAAVKKSEITIYFLAAPEDKAVCEAIHRHLTPIVRSSPVPITVLDDFEIEAGTEVADHKRRLLDADIVLSLISSNFIADDDIYDRNQAVIERYNRGETMMISVLAKNCMWKTLPLAQLPLLPKNRQPLDSWPNADEGFTSVVTDLYESITGMLTATEGTVVSASETPMTVDLTGEPEPALAGVGPGGGDVAPPDSDIALVDDPAASAVDADTDAGVTIELPKADVAPEVAPAPVAFTLNQPDERVHLEVDWRRKYYQRVLFKRLLALILDFAVLVAVPVVLGVIYLFFAEFTAIPESSDDEVLEGIFWFSLAMFYVIAPAMEASKWRATPGKLILKLEITDEAGETISYGRAFVRNVLRTLSLYSYILVFPLIIQYFRFRKTKQLFHGELSSTVIGERLAPAA